jgi:hypothetical protein
VTMRLIFAQQRHGELAFGVSIVKSQWAPRAAD